MSPITGLIAFVALLGLILLLRRKKRDITLPAMALAFAAGYLLAGAALPRWAGDPWAPEGTVPVTGRIAEAHTTSGGYAGYVLDGVIVDGQAIEGNVALTVLRGAADGREGGLLTTEAELERPRPSLYRGGFNLRGWYMRQGVRFTGFAVEASVLPSDRPSSLLDLPAQARQYAQNVLYRYLSPDSAGLVDALLSGDTGGIRQEIRRDFMDLGIAHLLAVSGLNITLTAGAAWLLCRKLRLPMPMSVLMSLLVLAGYVLFAGPTASVLRAAAMWLIGLGAILFARRYNPLSALAAAAILILTVNPLDLFDAGFQLSFAATAAMFLWVAPLLRHTPDKKWMKWFAGAAGVTVCVTLVALPVILGYFNSISLISPFANLVLVPASFVMQLAGTALVCIGFLPGVAQALGGFLDVYTAFYLHNVQLLSWSAATLPAATPPVWLAAAYAALVLLASPSITRFQPGGRGRAAMLVAAALAAALMLAPTSAALAGQSPAAAVAEGSRALSVCWSVDGSNYAACTGDYGELEEYLASRGVNRLDGLYMLAGEPPEDGAMLDAGRLRADRLYVPEGWLNDPAAHAFLTHASLLGMEPAAAERGPFECLDAGGEPVALLFPAAGGKAAFVPVDAADRLSGIVDRLAAADIVLLGAKPGKNGVLAGMGIQRLVLPGEIAGAGYPRYNIVDAGSVGIETRGGAVTLAPWIGGWADGIQGNFR